MRQIKDAANCGAIMLCMICCAVCSGQTTQLPLPNQRPTATHQAKPTKLPAVKLHQAIGSLNLQPVPRNASPHTPLMDVGPGWVDEATSGESIAPDESTIRQTSGETVLLPLEAAGPVTGVEEFEEGDKKDLVSLVASGAPLVPILKMIADHHALNLVVGPDVKGDVTISIRNARKEEVLDAILGVAGYNWTQVDNLLYVTTTKAEGMDPRVQGRVIRVYPLDYVAAAEVEAVANGLLSPIGSAYTSESSSTDQLRTRELLVVEDTVAAQNRISQFIAQIDIPPRQVLVEAHVLQVALTDEERHGINLKALARIESTRLTLQGVGVTDEGATEGKSVTFRIDGKDMQSVVELIRENSNSRTLASPKISVVNHQEAKIQIGQRLPYSVSTTTQTVTVESVEFLDVGIVLTVQPVITNDGKVLMTVFPKVSGGKILDNGFPEEETTEVQTTILMNDGDGVIIGGLIREEDLHSRAIVPYLGRIPVIGTLFRRRTDSTRRNELIVALVTHVIPEACPPRQKEALDLEQTLPEYAAFELMHPSGLASSHYPVDQPMLQSEELPPSILRSEPYQELPEGNIPFE